MGRCNQVIGDASMNKEIQKTKLDELLSFFVAGAEVKNLKKKTINEYTYLIQKFFDYVKLKFNIIYYEDLVFEHYNNYILYNTQKISAENSNRFKKYFLTMMNYCIKKKYYDLSVRDINRIDKVSTDNKVYLAYTDQDVENIIACFDLNLFMGYRMYTLVNVMLQAGLRIDETLSLDVEDILFDQKMIFVKKAKMRKQRVVFLQPELAQIIGKYIYYRNDSPMPIKTRRLFINDINKPLSYTAVSKFFSKHVKPFVKLSNGRRWGMHQYRIKFATEYINAGGQIEKLKNILGHEDITVTQRYIRFNCETIARNYENIKVNCNF